MLIRCTLKKAILNNRFKGRFSFVNKKFERYFYKNQVFIIGNGSRRIKPYADLGLKSKLFSPSILWQKSSQNYGSFIKSKSSNSILKSSNLNNYLKLKFNFVESRHFSTSRTFYQPPDLSEQSENLPSSTDNSSNFKTASVTHISDSIIQPSFDQENEVNKKSDTPNVSNKGWIQPTGHDTGIMLYNSLTKRKERFILPNGRIASWYTCGPTVYHTAHIGHASAYVRSDIIRRIMMNQFNIDVVMVMGVTDIDDKIVKRSKELDLDFKMMTRQLENDFFEDLARLNVMRPTVKTRVTEHIPQIITFIQQIQSNGMAYSTPKGNVYFDVQKYGRYGRLWTHSMDTEIRGATDKEKRNARDFALWKAAKPEEPFWPSPWGDGRPGWHIECSTMAAAIFGKKLDIHSGGDDLRFPHHENEMAQSEACFCTPQWTNYWLHTGHLRKRNDKEKMSKSLDNTISIEELLSKYTSNHFRFFCMLTPYRQSIEYSPESMQKAVRISSNWTSFLSSAEAYIKGQLVCNPVNESYLLSSLEETKERVEYALADDFDTPKAIHALEELVHRSNVELGKKPKAQAVSRSPGVIAAVVAYVHRVMDLVGLQTAKKMELESPRTQVIRKFDRIMDSVVSFRSEIRNMALNPANSAENLCISPKRILKVCDELRSELKLSRIKVQDHGQASSWDVIESEEMSPNLPVKKTPKEKPKLSK